MGCDELQDVEVVWGGEESSTTRSYKVGCLSGWQTQKPGGELAMDSARWCTVFKMEAIISSAFRNNGC